MRKNTESLLMNWPLGVLLFFHLTLLIFTRFTAWPEMSLWPYLMSKGWMPYQDIAIAHTPLALIDLTIVYKLFGYGIWQLKVHTWLLILILDMGLYWISKRLWNKRIALASLFFYVLLQVYYEGNGLWFDLAMTLPVIITFYLIQKKDFLWAGTFWALSFLTKQTAVWILFPLVYSLKGNFFADMKKVISGAFIIILFFLGALYLYGILGDFWFWAVKFGTGILPTSSGQVNLPSLAQLVKGAFPFAVFVFLYMSDKNGFAKLFPWAVAGMAGAFPRWGYFHLQPMLPFVSIALAIALGRKKELHKYMQGVFYLFVTVLLLFVFREYVRHWGTTTRFHEQETDEIVNYLEKNVQEDAYIYVLNDWDNIYALSNTLPAIKPWVPHLQWYMELPEMQEKITGSLEETKPEIIVVGDFTQSGLSSYKPAKIVDYIYEKYYAAQKIDSRMIYKRL